MNDWPTSLIERIKGRQAILVAGLGCSRLVGRPGWAQLAEQLIEWLDSEDERERVRELLAAGRIATAITFLRAQLTDEVVTEVLADAYSSGARAEGAVAKDLGLIARIPWRGVIATGFDDLWEGLLNTDAESPVPAFLARDAQALARHRGRFLLRLCGTVAAPKTICLSPTDLRARVTPTGITDIVDELYERWSFVFLGFGPDDPDFRLVSQRLLGANIAGPEHFLILSRRAGLRGAAGDRRAGADRRSHRRHAGRGRARARRSLERGGRGGAPARGRFSNPGWRFGAAIPATRRRARCCAGPRRDCTTPRSGSVWSSCT